LKKEAEIVRPHAYEGHEPVPSLSLPAADGADRSTLFLQEDRSELKYILD